MNKYQIHLKDVTRILFGQAPPCDEPRSGGGQEERCEICGHNTWTP